MSKCGITLGVKICVVLSIFIMYHLLHHVEDSQTSAGIIQKKLQSLPASNLHSTAIEKASQFFGRVKNRSSTSAPNNIYLSNRPIINYSADGSKT